MSGYYGAPNDFRNYLMHYGVKGMKWGKHKRLDRDGRSPLDWITEGGEEIRERTGQARRRRFGERVMNALGRAAETQRRNDMINGTQADRSRANARRHEMGERVMNALGRAAETQRRNDMINGTAARRSTARENLNQLGQRAALTLSRAAQTQRRNDTINESRRSNAKRKKKGNKYSRLVAPRKN